MLTHVYVGPCVYLLSTKNALSAILVSMANTDKVPIFMLLLF